MLKLVVIYESNGNWEGIKGVLNYSLSSAYEKSNLPFLDMPKFSLEINLKSKIKALVTLTKKRSKY